MRTFYEVRHKRENRWCAYVRTFETAQREFCWQWRDPDGSIPWDILMVTEDDRGRVKTETLLDPWTGEAVPVA